MAASSHHQVTDCSNNSSVTDEPEQLTNPQHQSTTGVSAVADERAVPIPPRFANLPFTSETCFDAQAALGNLPRPDIDFLSREVLRMKHKTILKFADENDVFLDDVLDHLISRPKPIISGVQKQDIKAHMTPTKRLRKLLEYLQEGGLVEFIELCNAIESFGNRSRYELATELRTALEKSCAEWREKERAPRRGDLENRVPENVGASLVETVHCTAVERTAHGGTSAGARCTYQQWTSSTPGQSPMNIVLVGTTGVGKTTLVNGLANYMHFSSFTEAFESNEHCLPMKIRVPCNDKATMDVCICEIGGDLTEPKPLAGAKSGDSVTQCSNIFRFQYGTREVRLIDTPGFSSTQEDPFANEKRMHQIVDFIKDNCTHLNAVCIVTKASENRIIKDFIHTIRNILDNLSKDMGKNLIVCLTYSSTTENCRSNEAIDMIKDCVRQLSGFDLQPEDIHSFENEAVRVLTENKLYKTNKLANLKPFRLETLEDRWKSSTDAKDNLLSHVAKLLPRPLFTSASITSMRQEVGLVEWPLKSIISCIIANKIELVLAELKVNRIPKIREKFIPISVHAFKIDERRSYVTVCRSPSCIKISEPGAHENGYVCHLDCTEHWSSLKCDMIVDGRCKVCNCDQSFHRRTYRAVRKTHGILNIPTDARLKGTLQEKMQAEDIKLRKYIDLAAMFSVVLKHFALSSKPEVDYFLKWLNDMRKSYSELRANPTDGGRGETARVETEELDKIQNFYEKIFAEKWENRLRKNDKLNEVRQRIKNLSWDTEYGDVFAVTLTSTPIGNPSGSTYQSCVDGTADDSTNTKL